MVLAIHTILLAPWQIGNRSQWLYIHSFCFTAELHSNLGHELTTTSKLASQSSEKLSLGTLPELPLRCFTRSVGLNLRDMNAYTDKHVPRYMFLSFLNNQLLALEHVVSNSALLNPLGRCHGWRYVGEGLR